MEAETKLKSRKWEEKVALVAKGALAGLPVPEIAARADIPERQVIKIIKEKQFKQGMKRVEERVVQETFKDKIPVLKEIVTCSLAQIIQTLKQMEEDEDFRALMITGVKDLAALGKLATDVNTLLRLENGESTANVVTISHSYQETRHIIQELKKKDPVFDYPELPEK